MEKLGWSGVKAQEVELEYRRFLYALARKNKNELISPPNTQVDEFWHQHILDTRKYREDCAALFGHYIDHTPGLRPEDQASADARRQRVYADYDIDSMAFDPGDGGGADYSGGSSSRDTPAHAHGHSADGSHQGSGGACDASGGHGGHGDDSGCGDGSGSGDGGGGGDGGGCSGGCGGS